MRRVVEYFNPHLIKVVEKRDLVSELSARTVLFSSSMLANVRAESGGVIPDGERKRKDSVVRKEFTKAYRLLRRKQREGLYWKCEKCPLVGSNP